MFAGSWLRLGGDAAIPLEKEHGISVISSELPGFIYSWNYQLCFDSKSAISVVWKSVRLIDPLFPVILR